MSGFKVKKQRLPADQVEAFAARAGEEQGVPKGTLPESTVPETSDNVDTGNDGGGEQKYPAPAPETITRPAAVKQVLAAEEDKDLEKIRWDFNLRSNKLVKKRIEAMASAQERSIHFVVQKLLMAALEQAEKEQRK